VFLLALNLIVERKEFRFVECASDIIVHMIARLREHALPASLSDAHEQT
jgi:hypothetical protein